MRYLYLCLKLDTAFVFCIWKRELIPCDKLGEELENTLCELPEPPRCGKIAPGDRDHDRDVDQPSYERGGARHIIIIFVYVISENPPSSPSAPHGKLVGLVQCDKPARLQRFFFITVASQVWFNYHAIIIIISVP